MEGMNLIMPLVSLGWGGSGLLAWMETACSKTVYIEMQFGLRVGFFTLRKTMDVDWFLVVETLVLINVYSLIDP